MPARPAFAWLSVSSRRLKPLLPAWRACPARELPYEHEHPTLAGVRVFPVSRFKKYLVFYRPVADGIEILRVLHGARDIDDLLAEGFELPGDDADDALNEEPDVS